MQERVGFQSAEMRDLFFEEVKAATSIKTWDELYVYFGINRAVFQRYRNMKSLLPKSLFEKLNALLPFERQFFFSKNIFMRDGNWGAVKGGYATYQKDPNKAIEQLRTGFKNYLHSERFFANVYSKPVNTDLSLSVDLCEFIGAIIGDGCISKFIPKDKKASYNVSITGDALLDKGYHQNKLSIISQNIFGKTPRFHFRKDSRTIITNFYSKQIFQTLTKRFGFIPGNKHYTVKIPEEIMNSEEKFIFATIRGLFDTDGCVFLDKRKAYVTPYPRIVFTTVSLPLFLQLKEILGEYFSLYTYNNPKKNVSTYKIVIYGQKQLEKWMELIGFSNERHSNKIKILAKDGT